MRNLNKHIRIVKELVNEPPNIKFNFYYIYFISERNISGTCGI